MVAVPVKIMMWLYSDWHNYLAGSDDSDGNHNTILMTVDGVI